MSITIRTRAVVAGLLFGTMLGIGGGGLIAATASGSYRYYSVAGVNYQSRATINNTGDVAQGYVGTTAGNAPSGWMGVNPRSFKGASLCNAGSTSYNSGASSGLSRNTPANCGAGTYFAQGSSFAWNGSSYSGYSLNRSPSLNIS